MGTFAVIFFNIQGGRRATACPACDALSRAGACGVAFTCRISTFSGKPEVELRLKDLWIGRYGDEEAEKELGRVG